MTTPNQENMTEWEREFDIMESKLWQFAGHHPDFKAHTCELVKSFIRSLLIQETKKAREKAVLKGGRRRIIEQIREEEREKVKQDMLEISEAWKSKELKRTIERYFLEGKKQP